MSDPILYQEKLLKPVVSMLERGVDQEDVVLRVLSLRALGNMALGAPKKVLCLTLSPEAWGAGPGGLRVQRGHVLVNQWGLKAPRAPQVRQYRKVLLEKCLCSLREPMSTSVTSEGMEALAKILAELREGDVGSSFDAISEQCRAFFNNVSPEESLSRPWPPPGSPQTPAQGPSEHF